MTTTTLPWITEHTPPHGQMWRITADAMERHTWGGLHGLTTYYWDVEAKALFPDAHFSIAPDSADAADRMAGAGMLSRVLAEHIRKRPSGDAPIVACVFQVEAWTLSRQASAGLDAAQRRRIGQGGVHTLPGAVERCVVTAADVAERVWWAHKSRRGGPSAVRGPADPGVHGPYEAMMRALMASVPPLYVAAAQEFWNHEQGEGGESNVRSG
ncbi:hypothetical protein ACTD5D_00395 [Nocardia takedensis]|uniref:hypothetical protein n=1 Tax=Nocardia takedensis TaxID=259390 RepID=UPI003F7716AB